MSKGIGQKCRLLLEGREVPFSAATIVCREGEPLTAMIDLVPLQVIKFIRPKTQVHLFVQDTFNFGDANFYLAFEGEVVGRGMSKKDGSRSFQITAMDYTGYWEEAKAYCFNPNFLVGKIEDTVTGDISPGTLAKAGGITQLTTNSTINSRMIQIILSAAKQTGGDLVSGVVAALKALNQLNLFYKTSFERLRINERIRINTSGKIKDFLKDLDLEEFLLGFTGRQGGIVSLREMLVNVLNLIFHSFVSVPFPSRVDFKANGIKVGETIGSYIFVPDGYSLPPPKCNVIFPNQLSSFDFTDDFRAAPTRFAFRASFPTAATEATGHTNYPMQFYPQGFSDYMFKTKKETAEQAASLLGTSSVLKDKSGRTYLDVKYGGKGTGAIGSTSVSPTLRESDFLTNEESVRGIFLDMETFIPGMTTLATKNGVAAVRAFTQEIGSYLFFKKRFSARNARATLLFHPFLVPGFNCLIVDDSEAGQSFIAKVQEVVHNLTNSGCSTTVTLGYARDFDEIDALSGSMSEPPLPKWFDDSKFGKVDLASFKTETSYLDQMGALTAEEYQARSQVKSPVTYSKLSGFYQDLIGTDSVTAIDSKDSKGKKSALVTTRGAAVFLSKSYTNLASSPTARDEFVGKYIRRPVPTLAETMFFLGAKPKGTSSVIPDEFAVFEANSTGAAAGRFDGKGFEDEQVLKFRREIIDIYADLLKSKRGFRG